MRRVIDAREGKKEEHIAKSEILAWQFDRPSAGINDSYSVLLSIRPDLRKRKCQTDFKRQKALAVTVPITAVKETLQIRWVIL